MDWVWRRLAPYVKAATAVEFSGITAEELHRILRQEALDRLKWVEAMIFNDEMTHKEKVQMIQAWFLER